MNVEDGPWVVVVVVEKEWSQRVACFHHVDGTLWGEDCEIGWFDDYLQLRSPDEEEIDDAPKEQMQMMMEGLKVEWTTEEAGHWAL